jgi:hypothetical protein
MTRNLNDPIAKTMPDEGYLRAIGPNPTLAISKKMLLTPPP